MRSVKKSKVRHITRRSLLAVLFILAGILLILSSFFLLIAPNRLKVNLTDTPTDLNTNEEPVSAPVVVKETTISVVAMGDVSTARLTGSYMVENNASAFQFVKSYTKKSDLTMINLETNLSTPGLGTPFASKLYTFNAPIKETIRALKDGGVDAVSIANNHTMDYGSAAFVDMMKILDANKIVHFGGGKSINAAFSPKYLAYENLKIALVGVNQIESYYTNVSDYHPGSAYFDEAKLKQELKVANKNADIIIVMPHWGTEHQTTANAFQKEWGHKFIDWGADIILGAHPHVIQNKEVYKGKTIFYSLGNFIFSGFYYSKEASTGLVVSFNIKDKTIQDIKTRKVNIDYNGFPKFID